MEKIDWQAEVESRKEELIADLQGLLQIPSVLDEKNATEDAPLGIEVKRALDYMLSLGEKDGFTTKNSGNVAGHLEMGEGKRLIGVLGHVDVVPASDGWSVDPFSGTVKDNRVYSRGAIDDKGPTLAAYYGMKIVKELGLPLKKRVRLIIGTDEESDWRCVERYFQHEEMPDMGFAPDADFPIIIAEKGIADLELVQNVSPAKMESADITLISFTAGLRYNMVPDYAKAVLDMKDRHTEIIQIFEDYLERHEVTGNYYVESGYSVLELQGKAAHGSEPEKGKNAGLILAEFLALLELDQNGKTFVTTAGQLFGDSRGRGLNISYSDEVSGELTVNVGILSYNAQDGGRFGLTIRYPVTFNMEIAKETIQQAAGNVGFTIDKFTNSLPHSVEEDSELIQVLKNVYEKQMGEKAQLLAIGGGTYARSLKMGVAFGALFPGRPDVAHQKDEYMEVADLLKATAIYAEAIYELASRE